MISFGRVAGRSETSKILFVVHSAVVGVALAVLVNSNQVAISVASQRYMLASTHAKERDESLGGHPVLAQPEHDVERSDYVMGGGHSSWPSIQQFDGIHRGRGLGNLLRRPRRPVFCDRVRKFISLEKMVDCIMNSAW